MTWAEACRKLGLAPATGSQSHLKTRAVDYGIDFSHFTGQAWNKGQKFKKKALETYLIKNSTKRYSHRVRIRLISDGVKKHQCEKCLRIKWNGALIPLELDHTDGDHTNYLLENLQILCPNCHAQTVTYCGKKLKKERIKNFCICGKEINKNSKTCVFHRPRPKIKIITKIDWPDKQELLKMLKTNSYRALGLKLGVSDNAIRKRLQNVTVR